jgi:hypothetical protein
MAEGMMGCRREDPEQGADVVIQRYLFEVSP